ncbi:MAG: c-type cytochrome [Bryobacteraceae bacterium]
MRLALPLLLSLATLFATELEQGKAAFRSNCAFCHGLTGGGGRGPNLILAQQRLTNDDLAAAIRRGVPGTTMPSYEQMEKDELAAIILYIRHLATGAVKPPSLTGDPRLGRAVYDRSGCAACHRIGTDGSIYGPDLTRIGAGRSSEYLRESLLDPNADIPEDSQGVTVVLRDGAKITGVRINEDTFSVQLRDPSQKFRMFDKAQVREVTHESSSLMPSSKSLPARDLENLLAYLDSLRGPALAGANAKKQEGIR